MRASIGLPVCLTLALAAGAVGWWLSPRESATLQAGSPESANAAAPPRGAEPAEIARPSEIVAAEQAAVADGPRVAVPEPTFDFGVMDRGEPGRKRFRVINEGQEVLTLRLASTTCKCTLADLAEGSVARVAPGKEFVITLEWDTSESSERFRHGAVIVTNDPATPQFELVVEGRVREHLAILPTLVYFANVGLSETRTQEVVLYSEAFDTLDIVDVEVNLPQLRADVRPADAQRLARLEVRQAYVIDLTLEPGLSLGGFSAEVRIHYKAAGGNPKMHRSPYTLSVLGEVVSDISIHGRSMEGNLLVFDAVRQSVGAKETVYLFARGRSRDLEILNIQATPDYLRVDARREDQEGVRSGRYVLTVEVPPGAVPVSLTASNPGVVELTTNLPDTPTQKFYVHLTVVP